MSLLYEVLLVTTCHDGCTKENVEYTTESI